jgi:hypothetical protein
MDLNEGISRAADDTALSVISLVITVVAAVIVIAAVYVSVLVLARHVGLFAGTAGS